MASAVDSEIETSKEENFVFVPEIPEKEKRSLTFHSDLSVTRDQSNNCSKFLLNLQRDLEGPNSHPVLKKIYCSRLLLPDSPGVSGRKMRRSILVRQYLHQRGCPFYTNIHRLRLAISTNNIELVERLLSAGTTANDFTISGQTVLHTASFSGFSEIVSLLLRHGADPNCTDSEGNTPLHLAVLSSYVKVVSLLLKAGANPLCPNTHGDTPLRRAQQNLSLIECASLDSAEALDLKFKGDVQNIVDMLIAVLKKKKDVNADKQIETLTALCSQLSLSNTSDQLRKYVETILTDSLNAI